MAFSELLICEKSYYDQVCKNENKVEISRLRSK